jgi:hypothetical protein
MTRLPLLVLALAAAGCGARGAFSQATMFKECSTGDATCRRATPAAPIAVGARIRPDVRVDVAGSVMPVVQLSSTREDVVAVEDGTLVAKQPGMSAVLIASADGTIIDFQHLWVAEATGIVVERPSPVGSGVEEVVGPLQLVAGEQVLLTSTMLAGAQRLAGESDLAWEVDGPATVTLLRDGASGRRRLVARAPGVARIRVAALGVETSFDVEVVP